MMHLQQQAVKTEARLSLSDGAKPHYCADMQVTHSCVTVIISHSSPFYRLLGRIFHGCLHVIAG